MNSQLLELIFLSEKRKNILLFLLEEPKTTGEIKEYLDANAVAVLPQLKKLREDSLVFKEEDIYGLSPLGIAVAGRMQAMVSLLNVFGKNYEYWSKHSVECIPLSLRNRIGDLENCKFSEPPDWTHLFEPHREFVEKLSISRRIRGIASIFHPLYPYLFLSFAAKGADISLLVTRTVYGRIIEEYQTELREFLKLPNSSFYVCDEKIDFSHVVTDRFLSLTLPFSDGTFDHKQDVLCFDPAGLQWGEDLFAYYRDRSEEITGI
ncbi:Transcriptional regulator, ArsR family [Methanosarcina siciliae C2J]|uniref:Transcriptional regulator, ArsR family n=1 Tax=Methanosarcina siciliae C2J TaxID=1434118 RepID=A0A0E3PIZ3_9EURY|nr:winged helix-turn-helix domain-containing protein [Methanosarcina siciliae]AKB34945.1 Transcriptional regulator, ArsR family [Methanosarcina siciliae C2J]